SRSSIRSGLTQPMKLSAYIDGGSRGNPGEAGIGVYCPGVVRISEYLGQGTNNYAEYSALVTALRFAVFTRCEELQIYADSELVGRMYLANPTRRGTAGKKGLTKTHLFRHILTHNGP